MFEGRAEEAMHFYVSLFEGARIVTLERFGRGEPGAEGSVSRGEVWLLGQLVRCFDSPVKHAFTFTPATSLFVDCESEQVLDELFAKLSEGGSVLMALGDYGFSRKFAWLSDRFGVSWQLNLPHH